MFRDAGQGERNVGDRITSSPWRSRWRGLRFGNARTEGSVSAGSEHTAMQVAPLVVLAAAAVHLSFAPHRWLYWIAVMIPVGLVSWAATSRVRRRPRRPPRSGDDGDASGPGR